MRMIGFDAFDLIRKISRPLAVPQSVDVKRSPINRVVGFRDRRMFVNRAMQDFVVQHIAGLGRSNRGEARGFDAFRIIFKKPE